MPSQELIDLAEVQIYDGFTEKQNFYVYWRQLGFTPRQAAKRAGYDDARQAAIANEQNKRINTVLGKMQTEARVRYQVDRDHVVEGLMEALSVAREQSDAKVMIQAWTELARITGVQAPEVKEIRHTGNVDVNHMKHMNDSELLAVVGRKRELTIDGEYETVEPEEAEE